MKISEVSEQYDLSADTLRYYERIGLIPTVNRNESGIRDYNELDLRRVDFIKCMRSAGLSVEVLIEYVQLVLQGDQTIAARKEILVEQRDLVAARIEEMQKTLDRLNYKVQVYEKALLKKEQGIVQIEDMEIIKSGGIHYKNADIHEVSVKIINTTAVLLNRITLLAVVGGNEVTNPFMVTEVYVQHEGGWKLASLSFTKLLTPEQPQ